MMCRAFHVLSLSFVFYASQRIDIADRFRLRNRGLRVHRLEYAMILIPNETISLFEESTLKGYKQVIIELLSRLSLSFYYKNIRIFGLFDYIFIRFQIVL